MSVSSSRSILFPVAVVTLILSFLTLMGLLILLTTFVSMSQGEVMRVLADYPYLTVQNVIFTAVGAIVVMIYSIIIMVKNMD